MFRKTSRIVAVAALVVGTLAGVGAAHRKAEQPLHVAVCCGCARRLHAQAAQAVPASSSN